MSTEPVVPVRRLRDAVAAGVITPAQLAQLLEGGAPAAATTPDPESARGFDAAHVAYWAGAVLVLFGFGWFLVDRWKVLGPGGVLGVALAYALLFVVVHVRLAREGFPVAAGMLLLLAVGMAPLAAWAAQEWLLPLDAAVGGVCRRTWPPFFACTLRWVTVELAAVLAALVAMRRLRFAPLALAPGVALFFLAFHAVRLLGADGSGSSASGWRTLAASSLLLALAYAVDRREVHRRTGGPLEDDRAAWLFLPALVTGGVALAELWGEYRELRHLLPLVSLALAAAALRLRRRLFLAAAAVALVNWLGWLAFDVFRDRLAFPLLLAAFGLLVIALAVAVQRLAPRVLRARPAATSDSPAAWAMVLAPLVLAVLMAPDARARDRDARAQRRTDFVRHAMHQRSVERERRRREGVDPAAVDPSTRKPGAPAAETSPHPRS